MARRGTLYATMAFDAKPYISAPPSYHLNTFGGQMGGPVRIPRLYDGRNKTFFEIGAEGSHYSKAGSTNILIPTQAQLHGDFSSAQTGVTKSGTCVAGDTKVEPYPCQLYDPTIANSATTPRRPGYLGNQIPVSEMNPYSLAFVNAVFGSATPSVIPGIPSTTDNFQITDPTRQHRRSPPALTEARSTVRRRTFPASMSGRVAS